MLHWKHSAILNGEGISDVHHLMLLPQDLLTQVDSHFIGDPLVVELCSNPARMLALLFLWALCLRIKRSTGSLPDLVEDLPDELLAIVKPQHVLQWIHVHLPRGDPKTDSFIMFAFDEVFHCFNHPCLNLSALPFHAGITYRMADVVMPTQCHHPSLALFARLTPRPDLI